MHATSPCLAPWGGGSLPGQGHGMRRGSFTSTQAPAGSVDFDRSADVRFEPDPQPGANWIRPTTPVRLRRPTRAVGGSAHHGS